MVSQDTQVCCCGASKWTSFFAWFHIVVASLAIAVYSAMLAGVKPPNAEINIDPPQLTDGMVFVVLAILILHVALTILLLIGSQREKLGLMWPWLIYTGITLVLVIIGTFMTAGAGDTRVLLQNLLSAAISAFMIYIVHLRMQDIKVSSGGRTEKV